MMIMSTDLYNVAMHRVVVAEQRKHGFINDRVEEEYLKGVEHTLTPESEDDDERALRLLTLLDALVFFGDHLAKYEEQLQNNYPKALAAAKKIVEDAGREGLVVAADCSLPFSIDWKHLIWVREALESMG